MTPSLASPVSGGQGIPPPPGAESARCLIRDDVGGSSRVAVVESLLELVDDSTGPAERQADEDLCPGVGVGQRDTAEREHVGVVGLSRKQRAAYAKPVRRQHLGHVVPQLVAQI